MPYVLNDSMNELKDEIQRMPIIFSGDKKQGGIANSWENENKIQFNYHTLEKWSEIN